MEQGLRNYLTVTGGYWAFTITDGAIRMLVVLYFHLLGYSPIQVAMLFLFYEFFGIVTNLIGGWLGAHLGLNKTMHIGMALQVFALASLMVPESWLSVSYVMLAQALSGIAKDLNKMSAKASIKMFVPTDDSESKLFKWIAILTGSKNALKGAGFFIGALLLQQFEFRGALTILSISLFCVLIITVIMLPKNQGKTKSKPKFKHLFSKTTAINRLSAARFFLFASRDIWFVVALPVYLYSELNWRFMDVGSFLALWVIGYGIIQACAPGFIRQTNHKTGPDGRTARQWAFVLSFIPIGIAAMLYFDFHSNYALIAGLIIFGFVFAVNSAVHSYLIVAWSAQDDIAMNVGFYYMANAGGRLIGSVLSGWIYQTQGLIACLIYSGLFVFVAAFISIYLPKTKSAEITTK